MLILVLSSMKKGEIVGNPSFVVIDGKLVVLDEVWSKYDLVLL